MRLTKNIAAMGSIAAVLVLAGCRQDMQDQPKFYPQRGTTFYADGRSVRPQVAGTVAREQMDVDSYFMTGLVNGKEGDGLPIELTAATMARGQERYNIYCSACHSRVGNGQGMIVERGYRPAGDFHTDRLRNAPLGHFFNVMTNGYGSMPDYAAQLTPADRWAVVAYIRALQLSQNAPGSDMAGTQAKDLHQIAAEQGMTPDKVDGWKMPGTAVYGTPNGQDNGIPGEPMGTPTAAAGMSAAGQPSGGTDKGTAALPTGENVSAAGKLQGAGSHPQ